MVQAPVDSVKPLPASPRPLPGTRLTAVIDPQRTTLAIVRNATGTPRNHRAAVDAGERRVLTASQHAALLTAR